MHPVVYSINEIILKNHQEKQIKLSAFLMGSLYLCMMNWMSRVGRMQGNVKSVLGAAMMHDSALSQLLSGQLTITAPCLT
jgi:hypothetical protein